MLGRLQKRRHLDLAEGAWRGNEATAASGGRRELSEWQRSAAAKAALSATKMPGTATVHFAPYWCQDPSTPLRFARDDAVGFTSLKQSDKSEVEEDLKNGRNLH